MPALADLIGDADLPVGRLLQGDLHDQRLDLGRGAVGQKWLAPTQLLQSDLAARVVELTEPVEAIARVAHHLGRLG